MATEALRFPYQIPRTTLLLTPVASIGVTAALAHVATIHDRFKDNLDAFSLLVYRAPALVWLLAAACAAATFVAIRIAVSRWNGRTIILTAADVTLPSASLSGNYIAIPYATISGLRRQNVRNVQTITIISLRGNCTLLSAGFGSAARFEQFKAALVDRMRAPPTPGAAQAPIRPVAGNASTSGSTRIVTVRQLFETPAGPRYGKRKEAVLDSKERAFDRILQRCFDYVGLTPWDTGPVYIVNADRYMPDPTRIDGTEIVLTLQGIELHEHELQRPGSHDVQRFDDLKVFLRTYLCRWIEGISQREVAKVLDGAAFQRAKVAGTLPAFFEQVKKERGIFEEPMRKRLDAFLTGTEVSEASSLLNGM